MNQWNHIYKMCKFIPDSIKRGSQLQKYISMSSLKILFNCVIEKEPSLNNVDYNVSDLLQILSLSIHSLQTVKLNTSLKTVIKFIDTCIQHLKLETIEEFNDLLTYLKKFENGCFSTIHESSTLNEQKHLVQIFTRLQLMTSELVPSIHNLKVETNYDYEEDVPIIPNIKQETICDNEQNEVNDMFDSNEISSRSKELLPNVKENLQNIDLVQKIENPVKCDFIKENDDPFTNVLADKKTLNLKSLQTHSNSYDFDLNGKKASLENKVKNRQQNLPNTKLAVEDRPILSNLQHHLVSNKNSILSVKLASSEKTLNNGKEKIHNEINKDASGCLKNSLENIPLPRDDKISSDSNFWFDTNPNRFQNTEFDNESRIHPSIRANELNVFKSTKLTTSVTINPDAGIKSSQEFCPSGTENNIIISSDIEINSPQLADHTTDICVRFSTKHILPPENSNRSSSSEVLPISSVSSKQKVGKSDTSVPEVCVFVEDNDAILVSDDDEIQIISTYSNANLNLSNKQKAPTNFNNKAINVHSKKYNSQIPTKKSSQKGQTLFNYFETSPNKKFKPNDTTKTNIRMTSANVNKEESDVMIIDTLSDDDCQIITDEAGIIILD